MLTKFDTFVLTRFYLIESVCFYQELLKGLDSIAFVVLLIDVVIRIHMARVGLNPSLDGSKVIDHMTIFDVGNVFLLFLSILLQVISEVQPDLKSAYSKSIYFAKLHHLLSSLLHFMSNRAMSEAPAYGLGGEIVHLIETSVSVFIQHYISTRRAANLGCYLVSILLSGILWNRWCSTFWKIRKSLRQEVEPGY